MLKISYKIKYLYSLIALFLVNISVSTAQLTVVPSGTAASLAAKLAGPGITIVSDTLICNTLGNGTFVSVSTPVAIDSGIILSTGRAANTTGTEPALTSTSFSGAGDADLNPLLGSTTVSHDACALIIRFVPKGDTISFRYQFGSEEYRNSTCGTYDDAFGFFISGPGISATLPGVNMALVPGTTVPVAVNSINNGVPGPGLSIATCNSMGAGSPFTSYYIDNTGGTQVSYRGYTSVLTAKHHVNPCDTYRIKMVIADASNYLYDSGVFIEAGSLKTNTYHFDRPTIGSTIASIPNAIVKTCTPDTITIKSSYTVPYPTVLNLAYSGSATPGFDYNVLPPSVTIPAGDSIVKFPVTGLATPTAGVKTIDIILTSASICGNIDSLSITLIDAPSASILTPDTIICAGAALPIVTTGTTGLTYAWSPAATLSNAGIANPVATPVSNTSYTMSATLPGSHCAMITDVINVSVDNPSFTILTPDTTICQGQSFTLRVNGLSSFAYIWTPATALSNPSAIQPVATPTVTTSYTATAISMHGCTVSQSVTITVIPFSFSISTRDTFLCEGATINLNAVVNPASSSYTYLWTGPNGYTSPFLNGVITTATTLNEGSYHLVVTNAGGCFSSADEYIRVYDISHTPILSPPVVLCQYAPSMPLLIEHYNNLLWYSDAADTTPSLFPPYVTTDSIGVQHFYAAQISFQTNCVGPKQVLDVTVESCCNGPILVPSAFTPNGDGYNDVMRVVRSGDYAITEFHIYDRWGNLIFTSTSEKDGWDGTIGGQPADMGTYYYSLIANCIHSDKHPLMMKGDITLIR